MGFFCFLFLSTFDSSSVNYNDSEYNSLCTSSNYSGIVYLSTFIHISWVMINQSHQEWKIFFFENKQKGKILMLIKRLNFLCSFDNLKLKKSKSQTFSLLCLDISKFSSLTFRYIFHSFQLHLLCAMLIIHHSFVGF